MSFRGDDQRRYGHVPPVQYPVANHHHQQPQDPARRMSFNRGDDNTSASPTRQPYPSNFPALNTGVGGPTHDELFIASPSASSHAQAYQQQQQQQQQHAYQPHATPPTPSSYNPQAFAPRGLPHHPAANRYPQSTPYSPNPAASAASSGNYTPAPYNPAAYSNANQRQTTVSGYNTYGNHGATATSNPSYPSPSVNQSPYWQPQPTYSSPPAASSQARTPPAAYPPYDTSPRQSNYPNYGSGQQTAAYPTGGSPQPPYPTSSQSPYPTHSQIPVGPSYSPHESSYNVGRAASSASSNYQNTGLARHPTNAPLPSRPAEDSNARNYQSNGHSEQNSAYDRVNQDNIMQDIEAELSRDGSSYGQRRQGVDQRNGGLPDNDLHNLARLPSTASHQSSAAATLYSAGGASGVGRYASNASTAPTDYSYHPSGPSGLGGEGGEDSDPEGAAGAWALQQAEMDERRLTSSGTGVSFPYFSQPEVPHLQPPAEEQSSDSDYAAIDLGLAGGGFAGSMAYGNNADVQPAGQQALTTPRINHSSQRSHDSTRFPAFEQADVDYGGTGGLQAPTAHRLSFDEGDEHVSLHSRPSGSDSPSYKDNDYPDMFYHPGLSNRPLPALPPVGSDSSSMLSAQSPNRGANQQHAYSFSVDSRPYTGPDAQYGQNALQLQVERSISLSGQASSPQVQPPGRSKTDANEDRNARLRHMRQQQQLAVQAPYEGYDGGTPSSMNYDVITLPSGRRRKFQPDKITSVDARICGEPWALSGIAMWIREMAEGEPDLKKKTVEDGLVRLFCIKVPTMNVADAEALSVQVTESMITAGILVPEEEWLKFGRGSISGVVWQLTGSGCYAPKLHEQDEQDSGSELTGRCYSHHCTRTVKKANLDELMAGGTKKNAEWQEFWKLDLETLQSRPKKDVARQHVLHEVVNTEEGFIGQLDVLRILYRDQLVRSNPPIISENRIESFVQSVFGKAEAIQKVNKDHLLAQLKYRQKEQGPWIIGFSDIFREWIRKARVPYVEYSNQYPYANYIFKRELDRNFNFKSFVDQNQLHALSARLDWSTYLKSPITRLQRYILLLETVHKQMPEETEEKRNLAEAIKEIREVALEADQKTGEMERKVKMIKLDRMLVLRPGFHADLNLDHLGRELILEGDLQRIGSKGMRWVDTHGLLFDHYLILAKAVPGRDGRADQKFDVSKEPIPMPLLCLDSTNEEPVSKQKGGIAPLTRTANTSDGKLGKVNSASDRPGLEHTGTSSSMASLANSAKLTPTNSSDVNTLYPFKLKHLGHETYTLYAPSAVSRQNWCDKITEAKTRHAKALHAQNAEPFRLRVMADSAFAYDGATAVGKFVNGAHVRGTPLDRAIREVEKTYGPGRGPAPISRANVNCATGFSAFGKNMIAVGTDVGVCVSEASDQRGWQRTITTARVTQIAILEEFSVVLVLSDRNLISYPLDVVSPPSNFPAPSSDSSRRSPQKLAKDVAFFATARMKDRMLVFFKRRENLHSTFKVLEPVFHKSSEKKSRLFGSSRKGTGNTESFRDYDEFYLPVECYSLNILRTYISISTAKGFELLTLDKKQPMSIPDVRQPAIANIANRIKDQKPLGMFRLNDQEFLLAYEDCAVYVDKHGDVSRSVIMEYSGKQRKAKSATMYGQYLLLFNEDYVEVRNAENGRLRQIIAGRDVRVLDYGVRGPTGGGGQTNANGATMAENGCESTGTVKISMAHPEERGQQILLEMLLNKGHMER